MGKPKNIVHITKAEIKRGERFHVTIDEKLKIKESYSLIENNSGNWVSGGSGGSITGYTDNDIFSLSSQVSSNVENIQSISADISGAEWKNGDNIDIQYIPSGYTNTTNTISGHFDGISEKLILLDNDTSKLLPLCSIVTGNIADISSLSSEISANNNDINTLSSHIGLQWKTAISGETIENNTGYVFNASSNDIIMNLLVPNNPYEFKFGYRVINQDNTILIRLNGAKWEGVEMDEFELDRNDIMGLPIYSGTDKGWIETMTQLI